jgi:hypothetical protein
MQRWRDILINFIIDLPSSNRFINIIVVVNCLIKMRYIIPIDLINAILVAECFIKYVCIITASVIPTACLRARYTEYAFTRSVHQPPAYASGTLLKH